MSETIAVADVGGTNARFALAEIEGSRLVSLGAPVLLKTDDYPSFEAAWQAFGSSIEGPLPTSLGLSFAGPVEGDELKMTNSPWVIPRARMEQRLGVTRHRIVNDFGAVGYAVAALGDDCFMHLCGPEDRMSEAASVTIVGPGTGLGVAQLHRRGGRPIVIETEGGHIDFASLDPVEDRILQVLRQEFGRVSAERVASGSGFANVYRALAAIGGQSDAFGDDELALWKAAREGSDPIAAEALDRFFLSLGAVAGDLALAHGADAVVIAGGLGLRLKDRFEGSGFARRFVDKGRFERHMRAIPVKLVTYPQPGLFGAAVAFAEECG